MSIQARIFRFSMIASVAVLCACGPRQPASSGASAPGTNSPDRSAPENANAGNGVAAASAQMVVPPAPQMAGDVVSASYACEGNRVDLVRNAHVARVAMSDGRVVRLGAMANSEPRTWRDSGLSFVKYEDDIALEQDDGPALTCQQIDR